MVAFFQIFANLLTIGPKCAENSSVSRIYHSHYKGKPDIILIALPREEYLIKLSKGANFEDLGESENIVDHQFEDKTILESIFKAHKRV